MDSELEGWQQEAGVGVVVGMELCIWLRRQSEFLPVYTHSGALNWRAFQRAGFLGYDGVLVS